MSNTEYHQAAATISMPSPVYPRATSLNLAYLALIAVVWVSVAIFGLYIVTFYGGSLSDGAPERWNKALPHLYESNSLLATLGIAVHFMAGAVVLVLGPIQLFSSLRTKWPALHRWIGRIYALTAFLAGVGGLTFIVVRGTIGGPVMTVGFSLYGALTIVASVGTVYHATQRNFEQHRAWAVRLFALAIGSWLYRIEYGFWHLTANDAGHTHRFDGPFDFLMVFLFYVPNLVVAEAAIRLHWYRAGPVIQKVAALGLTSVTICLAFGTYVFAKIHWAPPILHWLFGAN